MKKIIVTCILFLGLGLTGFAQSEKLKEKATEKVEQLNKEIMAGDESQALSESQKEQILAVQIERIKELRKANKDGADKEAKKAINKKHNQKIFKEILTKEQMKARKAGKENLKN
ncbi:hypothetical protein OAE03_02025 [Winogradskyella sp.]|nr:hypothetical protein [Winogradskyella sp.]MDB9755606.1 hypothetical protein [Winogradskyella sp.]MDC0009318.1 hypothetical protein [Winogradskyella sp.]MDC1504637.1 hypothetical protein [Winogradskyella sp.]